MKRLITGLAAVAMLGATAGVPTANADYWDRVEREMRQDYRQARRQARRAWRYGGYPYAYNRFGYYGYGYGYPNRFGYGYGADGAVFFPFGAVYW